MYLFYKVNSLKKQVYICFGLILASGLFFQTSSIFLNQLIFS